MSLFFLGAVATNRLVGGEPPVEVGYPIALTITNPGAEAGDNSGWTSIAIGAKTYGPAPGATTAEKNSGTYGFWASPTAATNAAVWFGQSVALPAETWPDIDDGALELTFSAWMKCVVVVVAEPGTILVDFFTEGGTLLMTRPLSYFSGTSWTQRTGVVRVPPLARTVRLSARARETFGGASIDFYIDDFAMSLGLAADDSALLWSSPEPTTSGWVTASGALTSQTGGSGVTFDDLNLRGGASTLDAYRPVAIPSDLYSAVDGGALSALLYNTHSGAQQGDTARSYLEFYDAGDAIIGSRVWSDASAVSGASGGAPKTISAAMPAGARTIRAGMTSAYSNGYLGYTPELFGDWALFATGV